MDIKIADSTEKPPSWIKLTKDSVTLDFAMLTQP